MGCYDKHKAVKITLSSIKGELEANRSFLRDVVLHRLADNDVVFAHRDIIDVMDDIKSIEKKLQHILNII